MSIIKTISLVITTACDVVVTLLSSFKRGASALDAMAEAGEKKAKNFRDLVELNDEAEFEKRKAEINAARETAGLVEKDIKSQQQQEAEAQAAAEAKKSAKQKEAEAKAQAELDI